VKKSSAFMVLCGMAGQAATCSLPLPECFLSILHHIFDECEGKNLYQAK
jgi:hypothetical protein